MKTTTEAELRKMATRMSVREIADALEANPNYIFSALRVLGIKAHRRQKRDEQAVAYVAMLERGVTVAEIAKEFNSSVNAVSNLLRGRNLPTTVAAAVKAKIEREKAVA